MDFLIALLILAVVYIFLWIIGQIWDAITSTLLILGPYKPAMELLGDTDVTLYQTTKDSNGYVLVTNSSTSNFLFIAENVKFKLGSLLFGYFISQKLIPYYIQVSDNEGISVLRWTPEYRYIKNLLKLQLKN